MKRCLYLLIIAICTLPAFSLRGEAQLQSATISYFSEEVQVVYHPDFILAFNEPISEKRLVDYFYQLQRRDFRPLLNALEQYRQSLRLNDWLYYELIRQSVQQIMAGQSELQRDLNCWFLLSQAGFDTRLTFRDGSVFVNVYSEEEVFEVPLIRDRGRSFVNLTSIHRRDGKEQQALYLLDFVAKPGGRSFSFYLPQLPRLRQQTEARSFQFGFGEYVYQLDVEVDQTIIDIMKHYPFIAENQYLEVPLSPSIASSLLPQLRQMINGKPAKEAVEFLVAFTRSSFAYRDDKEFFGHSKPMIADEVFHYRYSDCEDRAALFFQLVRDLLDLPMVIIAFDDHLTIGVALPQPAGAAILVDNRPFYICDPTGPANSSAIGRFPKGYEHRPYKIIGRHK